MKGELADHQGFTLNLGEGQIHDSFLVAENPQPGNLSTEPLQVFFGVCFLNAKKDEQTIFYTGFFLYVNTDRSIADPLNDSPHTVLFENRVINSGVELNTLNCSGDLLGTNNQVYFMGE